MWVSCKSVFILFHTHVCTYCTVFHAGISVTTIQMFWLHISTPIMDHVLFVFLHLERSFKFILTLLMILWVFKYEFDVEMNYFYSSCNFIVTAAFAEHQNIFKIKITYFTSHNNCISNCLHISLLLYTDMGAWFEAAGRHKYQNVIMKNVRHTWRSVSSLLC